MGRKTIALMSKDDFADLFAEVSAEVCFNKAQQIYKNDPAATMKDIKDAANTFAQIPAEIFVILEHIIF